MNPFENRFGASARTEIVLVFVAGLVPFLGGAADASAADWPLYSHDYDNSNFNPDVSELTATSPATSVIFGPTAANTTRGAP